MIKRRLKNAWKSFTIWFNGVALAVLPIVDGLKDFMPQIQDYIDDGIFKKTMLVLIICGNILIRFKTATDLADK